MANGKWQSTQIFRISHVPFPIQTAFFSILPRKHRKTGHRKTQKATEEQGHRRTQRNTDKANQRGDPENREMTTSYTIGVDFGTNSVRAVVIDCADGRVLGTNVFEYPSGEQGILLHPRDPHLARQNPADYIEGLRASVTAALAAADEHPAFSRDRVIGIGVDTTGSTPMPVDASARPLALDPRWKGNLAAHAWLWKDHTSADEAAAITETAARNSPQYLAPIGGTYSSEWWWSKIWHCLNVAPDVFDAAASWVELADFVPAVLAGVDDPRQIVRCVCAAGHKAMYSEQWGGLPDRGFLARLNPKLADLRDRLYDKAWPPGRPAGGLAQEWAGAFGVQAGIVVAMGGFDAHYGAVGSGIQAGTLVKIIGTSTCDCAIAPVSDRVGDIPGICGIVNGSIMPDCYGIEAGQSAVGDILKWWVETVCKGGDALHAKLSDEAARLKPGESGLVALDWNNGNRTILVDPRLTGLIAGQTLHTTRAEIYRALIEATAFGARAIIERIREHGVRIERVVCCGGIAEKNDLFMQIYADVIGQPMLIAGSPQAPALGAAISAAVTAGAPAGGYATWREAQQRMTSVKDRRFTPDPAAHEIYNELYGIYRELHDTFGGVAQARGDLGTLMKRLLAIKGRSTTAD
jgi:L-ribulokinase